MFVTIKDKYKRHYPKGVVLYNDMETRYNCRVKKYADGSVNVTFAPVPIYRDKCFVNADLECERCSSLSREPKFDDEKDEEEYYLEKKYQYRLNSAKRSKKAVFDIVCNNTWDFFFTGTISPDSDIDRYDVNEVSKAVNRFMYNLVRSGKVIRYIFVPEEHKDGAVHYHGFIKMGKGCDFVPARHPKTRRFITWGKGANKLPVFNWLDWEFGFTTLIPAHGTSQKRASYICKYITKGECSLMKHRYYCAGDVNRKVAIYVLDVPFKDVPLGVVGCFKYASFDDYNSFLEFLQVIDNHSTERFWG